VSAVATEKGNIGLVSHRVGAKVRETERAGRSVSSDRKQPKRNAKTHSVQNRFPRHSLDAWAIIMDRQQPQKKDDKKENRVRLEPQYSKSNRIPTAQRGLKRFPGQSRPST